MDYSNKKRYKKDKAKQRARKEKAIRRGCAIKADNRDQKAIEKLKWIHREKLKPVRKNIDD
tara:strand:+ start:287 stop:469 length:183 start_codon:yes stop_codon:yes gene_type:complete